MLKVLGYILCYLFYPLSFLIPRRDDLLVFGSFHGGFNENSKYLFLYCNEHLYDRRSIWITTRKSTATTIRALGLEAYTVYSLKGLWYSLRARYWFVNCYTSDILFCLAGNAVVVNLWHGLPWKCIEFGIKKGALARRYSREDKLDVFMHPACFRKPQYLISGSDFVSDIFSMSFRIEKSRCLETGYPRDMLLLGEKTKVEKHINKYEPQSTKDLINRCKKYNTVYIYMPTWRDSQRNLFAAGLDLNRLNDVISEQDALLLMKPHPNTRLSKTEDWSNIYFVDKNTDIYSLLPYTDVLITDYSSVMFDYPLMRGKGMILYQYDYDDYIAEREFNFSLEGNIIGKKVMSFEDLLDVIRRRDYNLEESERKAFIKRFWGEADLKNSCHLILEKVFA